MAITLSAAYLAELRKGVNMPTDILEVVLDSGTEKWGTGRPFVDVMPIVKTVSSQQNKLDTKKGYSTRGQLTVTIQGREKIKSLIANEYLTNRTVIRKHGFITDSFLYSEYAPIFTGTIVDWRRKGDKLTLIIADSRTDASKKIPVEVEGVETIDFRNTNVADVMTTLLLTHLGVAAGSVDSTKFASERDTWLSGWMVDRVLHTPISVDTLLNELQAITNSYIVDDGEKLSFKVIAPPVPGTTLETWSDSNQIILDSFSQESGLVGNFFNRIVVYYNYDEGGSDDPGSYESWHVATDADSLGASEWDKTKTKEIKTKWFRTLTYTAIVNATGATLYHISKNNGQGSGTVTFTYDAGGEHTFQWTPPGGTIGEAVTVSADGKYQLFGTDKNKWCRIVVDHSALPGSSQTDTIAITGLNGEGLAVAIANKALSTYRNPRAVVSFRIGLNNVAWGGEFIKPTDLKAITTDEAFEKGEDAWTLEKVVLTSVRPDFSRGVVEIEAMETAMYRRGCFIAPSGYPDYDSATEAQREYGYIGNANNKVGTALDDGYYII